MKFSILILLVAALLIVPIFSLAECNKIGTTVIFVNGIFGELKFAQADAKSLAIEYALRGKGRDISFINGYNASHAEGVADLVEAAVQMYLGGFLDHDLTDILRQIHADLKTQRVLLVGHSQGTFYTNAAYDYLIGHGVDKGSIAVYNVATPANKVAGDGNYLTSSSDKIIDSIARKLATVAVAKKPLPANIDIKIPDNPEIDYSNGHSFSNAYLGLVPDKIISGIDNDLNSLTANSDKNECFIQPELGTMYRVFDLGYQIVDSVGEYSQYAVTTPTITEPMQKFGDVVFNGIYNFGNGIYSFGRGIFSNVASAIGQGTAGISSFIKLNSNSNLPTGPIISPELTVEPFQPIIPEEIIPPVETLSYQDQLDDIEERLDIIRQQVQTLIDQQNQQEDDNDNDNKNQEKNSKDSSAGSGTTRVNYPKILISEVQISPIGQRFIELYNPNSTSVSLIDWYLQRKDNNDSSWGSLVSATNFEGKTIQANGYFLISREIGGSNIFSNITLTNDNSLALKNPNGEISDKLGFGLAIDSETTPTINPAINLSIGRKLSAGGAEQDLDNNLADFEANTPTPGAHNIKYIEPPAATLSSIAITTPAGKIIYNVGEVLDITGLVVTGTYSDASTRVETVTATNITGFDSTIAIANQILTVTIGGKTTNYSISVNNIFDATPPSITSHTISNQVFSPNGDTIEDTTSIDLAFSEDVKVDFDIINSSDVKVKDIYDSVKVKNPDAKIWDGKDNAGILVAEGVYTIKIVITDMADNSVTDISKKIAVDNFIPSSTNFTITPTCVFSSPDVSDSFGNSWGVVGMCSCGSPAWSDEIKGYGIEMKTNCGWNSSTNQVCNDVSFHRNGDAKIWTYQTIYIINGICSLNPTLPDPVPSSDIQVNSSVYVVSIPIKGSATVINVPFAVSKADLLANLTKNQAGQTWDDSLISNPPMNGDKLIVIAEDGISKATYTISVPSSSNFTITPTCVFSSPDVSGAYGNSWSSVGMCGCLSPNWSNTIRDSGHDMKICGWNASTNQTCYDVSFGRNGDSKRWAYQTIYIINGVCTLTPSNTPIDMPVISGIRPPFISASPVAMATETPEYTSTVSWTPNDGVFIGNTVYTAKITITPKTAYSLAGIPENFFTVAGTSSPATNSANSGVINATFPVTNPIETTIPSINYNITPDCIFSSSDVSNAYGNYWSTVGMCGCLSPNWSNTIRDSGHDMKICGWNASTNQTCDEITFGRNGSTNRWAYPAVYIENGVCKTSPTVDATPPSIVIYAISNETISPNGDGDADTTEIDLKFSEEVKVNVDILDAGGVLVFKDFYKSDKVTNPQAKTWDGKDGAGTILPNGIYTIKIVITDMVGNSITDTSRNIIISIPI